MLMPPPIRGAHKGSIMRFTTPGTWMPTPNEGTARRVSGKTAKQFLGRGFEEPSWGWLSPDMPVPPIVIASGSERTAPDPIGTRMTLTPISGAARLRVSRHVAVRSSGMEEAWRLDNSWGVPMASPKESRTEGARRCERFERGPRSSRPRVPDERRGARMGKGVLTMKRWAAGRFALLVILAAWIGGSAALAEGQPQPRAGGKPDQLGTVHFVTSCKAEVQPS